MFVSDLKWQYSDYVALCGKKSKAVDFLLQGKSAICKMFRHTFAKDSLGQDIELRDSRGKV